MKWRVLAVPFLALVTFFATSSFANDRNSSCEPMLTSLGFSSSMRGEAKPRPRSLKPRENDLDILPSREEWIEEQSKKTNLTYFELAFQPVTELIHDSVVFSARRILLNKIQIAGKLAQSGELTAAISILNDPRILNGTGFRLVNDSSRESIYSDSLSDIEEERIFSNVMIQLLRNPPRVDSLGRVYFPHPPRENSAFKKKLVWAQREWIRTASEELGHVAQIIGRNLDPSGFHVSRLLSQENSALRSEIFFASDELNRDRAKKGLKPIDENLEADIYAFLVETYGPEFIPFWFGKDSGYTIREMIDEEYTRQGVPSRQWSTVKTQSSQSMPRMTSDPAAASRTQRQLELVE